MISYIIIEDEQLACEEIARMTKRLRPSYRLAATAHSVEDAIRTITNDKADLLIVDIRLSDGICFDIFDHIRVNTPVIFTTAYDEYALQAFRVNSVDYLLKPIEERDLQRALEKFETNSLVRPSAQAFDNIGAIYMEHVRKNRFLVSVGDTFRYVETGNIAFFYSEEKYVYLQTFEGKTYIVNQSLDQLYTMLDEKTFFRVSRNCVANIRSIKSVSRYFGGRLKVKFTPECPPEVIVSRSRTADFLRWMDDM